MSKTQDKWLQNPGGSTSQNEVPTGAINGVNKDFIISVDPKAGSLRVFLNSLLDMNFTFDGPSKKITMTDAPVVGQSIRAVYNS